MSRPMKPCHFYRIFDEMQKPLVMNYSSIEECTEMDALEMYIQDHSDVMEKTYINNIPHITFKDISAYNLDVYVCDMRNNMSSVVESSKVMSQKKYKLVEYLKKVHYKYGMESFSKPAIQNTQDTSVEEVVTEGQVVKLNRNSFKVMTLAQLSNSADKLMKSDNRDTVRFGQSLKSATENEFGNLEKYFADISMILFIGGDTLKECMPYIVSSLLYMKDNTPQVYFDREIKNHRKIVKSKLKPNDDTLRLYYDFLYGVINNDLRIVNESVELPEEYLPLVEARQKRYSEDFGRRGPKDYTDDIEDEEDEETESEDETIDDETEEETTDDEGESEDVDEEEDSPTDYTDELDDDTETPDSEEEVDEDEPEDDGEDDQEEDDADPETDSDEEDEETEDDGEDNSETEDENEQEEDRYSEDFGDEGPSDYSDEVDTDDSEDTGSDDNGDTTNISDTGSSSTSSADTIDDDNDGSVQSIEPAEDDSLDTETPSDSEDNVTDDTQDTQQDGNGLDEEPTDYTEDSDTGSDSDNTNDSDLDSGEDGEEGDDTTDEDESSNPSDDSSGEEDRETSVKNYNIRLKLVKLAESIEDILSNLSKITYRSSIQNSVLERGIDNITKIKEQIISYMEYNLTADYKQNLYYYTIFMQALQLNLDMLTKNSEMSNNEQKDNK